MKKNPPKGPPPQIKVATPYGHPPLVAAAEELVKSQVTGDITALVKKMAEFLPSEDWGKYLNHSGWVDPAGRVGLLDFSYNFPKSDSLDGMTITLLVVGIEGGNGEPLHMGSTVARCHLGFAKGGWGELVVTNSGAENPEWNDWIEAARQQFKADWVAAIQASELVGLSNPLGREGAVKRMLQKAWTADNLQSVLNNLALDLVLIDDEDEAEHHCSSLEFSATEVLLVSNELAEELKKRGALAGVYQGLPLWSRDSKDAPHLERVVQDIAYDKFGRSQDTQLADSKE